ncbi:three-Cys-motif partner protein TcmP [Marinobacter xestospongiae]|uniref:three-Cys-motif partner protein TcmP n=1 Tax=Marinobacter xestospongiae TaxID=994319 RepID=UPI0020038C36|nr:three-Cys-motif partner protein TcmP [Marinobacter xestospongiae]
MSNNNFFDRGFDDKTSIKLGLYESYLTEYLGVWVASSFGERLPKEIDIYDFFAGPGVDGAGVPGSPMVAFEVISKYADRLAEFGQRIRLWLSDISEERVSSLKSLFANRAEWPRNTSIEIHQMEFVDALNANRGRLGKIPALIFADQFGVKYITPEIFAKLASLKATDLIFFISSWTLNRFSDHDNIKKYHQGIGEYLKDAKPGHIHRKVKDYYQSLVPKGRNYHLAPFSMKKGGNVHGIIFGTSHIAGMRKFLNVAWKIDVDRGEADFDIDEDRLIDDEVQMDMLGDDRAPKKVELFEDEVRQAILSGKLASDQAVHEFSIYSGFLPVKHAKPVVDQLRKDGVLQVDGGRLRLGDKCCEEPRRFTVVER